MIRSRSMSGKVLVDAENSRGCTEEWLTPEEAEALGRRLILDARQARRKGETMKSKMVEDHQERPGVHEADRKSSLRLFAEDCPLCREKDERG